MSPTSAQTSLLARTARLIPPLQNTFHKGQMGRVAVLGGSQDYTGAPFFSAIASARLGCDMSHVICTSAAASVIKTYSPNLMVHPLMEQTPSTHPATYLAARIIELFPRLHVLVIGPGLGRDPLMHETVKLVIEAAIKHSLPIVLDADALLVVEADPSLVKSDQGEVILTPNVAEFARLCKSLKVDNTIDAATSALPGVTIIQKGNKDIIARNSDRVTVDIAGGRKRSGGQGDTLTGCIATFMAWRRAYHEKLWKSEGDMTKEETLPLAVYGACAITRGASRLAFEKRGRSLQAGDLEEQIHPAFLDTFGGE